MSVLLGAWRLESWSYLYEDGRPPEFPMGADARGYILYTPQGHVSATIMRADGSECFAYAGRYELADGTVFHNIELSTNKVVLTGRAFARASYDIPGQQQRFARQRGQRDAENRSSTIVAEQIKSRLASYFISGG